MWWCWPSTASRAEALADACAKWTGKLLLVTSSTDHAWMDSAVMAGVRGVVRTGEPPEALLKAIEKVDEGELWIDRGATSRIFMEMARQKAAERDDPDRSKIATLTLRERQTIAAVASDASAPGKVIADRLCISEHTLRNHLSSIYNKLGVCNRLDLYAFATRHSLHELR
jgi:DNA-binding NarL/FixJ family response regulator